LTTTLSDLPAVMVTGPRACGKTTTAARHATSTVHLDDERRAGAFLEDPDASLRSVPTPVLLDEWQQVPGVLGAVKRAVDADLAPNRFILTGSVRTDLVTPTWPATGRVVRVAMYPLSASELVGRVDTPLFIDRLTAPSRDTLRPAPEGWDLSDYVDAALRGGFPPCALAGSQRSGRAWLAGYVDQLATADPAGLGQAPDRGKLARYLEALAINTAGIVDEKKLYDAVGIAGSTARAYRQLMENLVIATPVPAWSSNRLSRLTQAEKKFLVDPSLVGAILHLDRNGVLADAHILGRLIETFVAAQVRAEVSLKPGGPRLYHLRDKGGRHEVDLIVEYPGGDVAAIEVKSSGQPIASMASNLRWLRDAIGHRFMCGVVLHTGPMTYQLDEAIFAAPISTLWA
jgi:predicted AAA+ superfamily ATPase